MRNWIAPILPLMLLAACTPTPPPAPSAPAAPAAVAPPPTPEELVVTHNFKAPPKKIWNAWLNTTTAKKWWGSEKSRAPVAKMDLRVGGNYLLSTTDDAGNVTYSTGTYTKFEKPNVFEADDYFADAKGNKISAASLGMPEYPDKTHLKVEFKPSETGGTLLVVTQTPAPKGKHYQDALENWQAQLDKLEKIVQ